MPVWRRPTMRMSGCLPRVVPSGFYDAGDLADGFVESGESRGFADGLHGELQLVVGPSGAAAGVAGGHAEQVVESVARLERRRGAGCSSARARWWL